MVLPPRRNLVLLTAKQREHSYKTSGGAGWGVGRGELGMRWEGQLQGDLCYLVRLTFPGVYCTLPRCCPGETVVLLPA